MIREELPEWETFKLRPGGYEQEPAMQTPVGRVVQVENKEVEKSGSIVTDGVGGEERPGAHPLHCRDP